MGIFFAIYSGKEQQAGANCCTVDQDITANGGSKKRTEQNSASKRLSDRQMSQRKVCLLISYLTNYTSIVAFSYIYFSVGFSEACLCFAIV